MKNFALIFAALCAPSLFAQTAGNTFFDKLASGWQTGVSLDASECVAVPADIESGMGDMGVYETSATLKLRASSEKSFVDFSAGWTHSYYDFGANSPFSNVNKISADLFFTQRLGGGWSVFAIGSAAFAAESSASLAGGYRVVAGCGAGYAFSENLRAGIGLAAFSRMDRNWLPLPVGFINWKIDEHWSVKTMSGAVVEYDVYADGALLLHASCEYVLSYIRLSDSALGARRCVSDSYCNVSFGATCNFSANFYVSASAGFNCFRELVFRERGDNVGDPDVDAAPTFFFHAGCRF